MKVQEQIKFLERKIYLAENNIELFQKRLKLPNYQSHEHQSFLEDGINESKNVIQKCTLEIESLKREHKFK